MHTKKPVSNIWLLVAICMGLTLFIFITIVNEMKPKPHVTLNNPSENISPTTSLTINNPLLPNIPLTQKQAPVIDPLSTPLNTRYEDVALSEDSYCTNSLSLSAQSTKSDWNQVREFLDGHFYGDSSNKELALRTLISDSSDATIISICQFAEELYALRQTGTGEEFAGYDLVQVNDPLNIITSFILPLGRLLRMRTDIFEDDALFVSARQGDAAYTAWYYFKFDPAQGSLEQVEWCDRWYGGGNSPYGDEPNLTCEYTYAF
jgi:hypothetical protein